jgi:hypothetical protein
MLIGRDETDMATSRGRGRVKSTRTIQYARRSEFLGILGLHFHPTTNCYTECQVSSYTLGERLLSSTGASGTNSRARASKQRSRRAIAAIGVRVCRLICVGIDESPNSCAVTGGALLSRGNAIYDVESE